MAQQESDNTTVMEDSSNNANDIPPSEKPKIHNHGQDAPDGGTTAWLVVLGVWCTSFCSFGWITSMKPQIPLDGIQHS